MWALTVLGLIRGCLYLDSNKADNNSNLQGMVSLWRGATQVFDATNFVIFPVEVFICTYTWYRIM